MARVFKIKALIPLNNSPTLYAAPRSLAQVTAGQRLIARLQEQGTGKGGCVGTHVSKSTVFPVIALRIELADRLILEVCYRNNLHDIEAYVYVHSPEIGAAIDADWSLAYGEAHGKDWYAEQIARRAGYSFNGWTEAEQDDPDVLLVQRKGAWNSAHEPEAKLRWTRRRTDPSWFIDWSGVKPVLAAPAPDIKVYMPPRMCNQGMTQVPEKVKRCNWEPGSRWIPLNCGSYDELFECIDRLLARDHARIQLTPLAITPDIYGD
jgi:hypothetical protein